MSRLKLAALIGAACMLSSPAFAETMKEGTMMMIMPNGQTKSLPTPSNEKAQEMLQHAQEMKDGMAFIVWGQKLYVLKNEKMDNGKMTFDYWGLRGER